MKKTAIALFSIFTLYALLAGEKLRLFKAGEIIENIAIENIDSITFTENDTKINIFQPGNLQTSYAIADIDSVNFIDDSEIVKIIYSGNNVIISNPFNENGVTITSSGAKVTIQSTLTDKKIAYQLSGTSTAGSVKIYSDYRFELILNGVNLTNDNGPAINIQSKKRVDVTLKDGTTNTLADGATYATSSEDQKATLFSEGQLVFDGNGTLNVSSATKHGICSDDYIAINNGSIQITNVSKDGIHAKDYFKMTNGTLNVAATSDGIDCEGHIYIEGGNIDITNATADTKGIASDSTLNVSGGIITLKATGNQVKAMRSKLATNLTGGNININTSGNVVLTASGSGYDPSYCTAIKSNTDINVEGSAITIAASGIASKGLSADQHFNMSSGTITITNAGSGATYTNISGIKDSYSATSITIDGNATILGGTITTTNSGTGGKGISGNGTITIGAANTSPSIKITTTGAKFLVSGSDYCMPKAMKSDGAITINNGGINIASSDDGIKSETSVTINSGNLTITNSYEGIESKFIYLNGGTTNVTATNDGLNATMGTVSGGTESNDGSHLYIKGGTHYANATSGDAIDSNGNITMTGGFLYANGPSSGVEEAVDFNGNFYMNGGTFIGAGSKSNMTKAMSTGSTQANMYVKSSSIISSSTLFNIRNASGTDILTFTPKYGGYYFLISSPDMAKGATYTLCKGGSYSGGSTTNNVHSGGTYSITGATTKSVTLSTSATVNTITW